jgi:hypothetical protein
MQFQNVASGLMEPCDKDDLLTDGDSSQALRDGRNYFYPSVRCAFLPLFGGVLATFE